ncbi:MAG: hypothetical protein ACNA71_10825, partial [Kiritimatiellia bacterium]
MKRKHTFGILLAALVGGGTQAMASWTLPASGGSTTNFYTDADSVWAAHIFTSGTNYFTVLNEDLDIQYLLVGGG